MSLFFCLFSAGQAQITVVRGSNPDRKFTLGGDIYGTRNFIENKGQFDALVPGQSILFVYDHGEEKIYFTPEGLVYEHIRVHPLNREQRKALERGLPTPLKDPDRTYVYMKWAGASPDVSIESGAKQSHYFTYGAAKFNSYAYKRITYRNIYDNIDFEFTIPEDREKGVKYNVVLRPGARLSDIQMVYSGDIMRMEKSQEGEIIIETPLDKITDHPPLSFCGKNVIASAFTLENTTVGFALPQAESCTTDIVIDPWITAVTTLSNNNNAYDVDYDFNGNTFIYGGNTSSGTARNKVAMLNSSGTIQWTFSGSFTSGWHSGSSWSSNFKVNRGTSKTYLGRNLGTPNIVRLDASGNYDNFSTPVSGSISEIWNIDLACNGDLIVYGGAFSSGELVSQSTGSINLLTTFDPNVTGCCQDIVAHATDITGNAFVYFLGHTTLNHQIALLAPSFTNTTWRQSSGFSTMAYLNNKSAFVGGNQNGPAVSLNNLAVNMNYLYYYDGYNVGAYSKSTGTMISSATAASLTSREQVGIAVDDCDNVYVGGNGDIRVFHFNGTAFSTLTPISLSLTTNDKYVYDVQYDKSTNILHVSGSGFVTTIGAAYSNTCVATTVSNACAFGQYGVVATGNSITCANLGSATVTTVGPLLGPLSYTWMPSSQTGSVATGLIPGTYTVTVKDQPTNFTFTQSITFLPVTPLTGSLNATPQVACFGSSTGSASIFNLSGGSGNQSYLWTGPSATLTTPTATGLGIGNWSVTVTDALTYCTVNHTFVITQPPALTLNVVASSPSACAGTSISLTALIQGGTPNYSYSWVNGSSSGNNNVTAAAGTSIFTLNAFDSRSCPITRTVQLTFLNNPTLTTSNASICPLETATLSVSGATTYVWSTSASGPSITASPPFTTVYTVTGSGVTCSTTKTVAVIVKPLPIPILTSNSPVCAGNMLTVKATGGTGYLWTGPGNFSSSLSQPSITPASLVNGGVYVVTVTAANSCTAASSLTAVVNATPVVSAIGSTVCETSPLNLQGNSSILPASFVWSGPATFTSNLQNPQVLAPLVVGMSGNYSVTATDQNGCSSKAVAHVTISSVPQTTLTSNTPICELAPLSLGALGASPAFIFAWTGPDNFTSTQQFPSLNSAPLAAAGVYSVSLTNGPCVSDFTTGVVVNALPVITIQGSADVCETKTLVLTASATGVITSWLWAGPGNFYTSFPSFSLSPADPAMAGTYTITTMNVHSCFNKQTINVQVLPNPTITVSDMTVCLNAPAVLDAQGALSYLWIGPGGFLSAGKQAMVASATNPGKENYTVIGTAANSCTSSAILELSTRALPVPVFTVSPSPGVCEGQTITLSGSGGVSYRWSGPDKLSLEGEELTLLMRHVGFGGTYTLTVTDSSACQNSTERVIPVYALPVGNLSGKMEGCVPFCADYNLSAPTNVTAAWRVNGKQVPGSSFGYCFTKPLTYTLSGVITDTSTKCVNTIFYHVDVFAKPNADFTFVPETPIENFDEVKFTPVTITKGNTYTWYYDQKEGEPVHANLYSAIFDSEGYYKVALVAESTEGCIDTVVRVVRVEPGFHVYVPDAFSPNGDEFNNVFQPVTRGIVHFHLQIFNRWGILLFETRDPQLGWDGTYKGKPAKEDVYVYLLTVADAKQQRSLKGHVTLTR